MPCCGQNWRILLWSQELWHDAPCSRIRVARGGLNVARVPWPGRTRAPGPVRPPTPSARPGHWPRPLIGLARAHRPHRGRRASGVPFGVDERPIPPESRARRSTLLRRNSHESLKIKIHRFLQIGTFSDSGSAADPRPWTARLPERGQLQKKMRTVSGDRSSNRNRLSTINIDRRSICKQRGGCEVRKTAEAISQAQVIFAMVSCRHST